MSEILIVSVLIACIAAFIVTLMHKWGAVEYMQVHADDFPEVVNKLFSCDFCLSWWVSVIISIVLAITMSYLLVLLCPFVATPVAKFILR